MTHSAVHCLWPAVISWPAKPQRPTTPLVFPQMADTARLEPVRAIRMLMRDASTEVAGTQDPLYGTSARAVHDLERASVVHSSAQAHALLTVSLAATSPALLQARPDKIAVADELLQYALSLFLGWRRNHLPAIWGGVSDRAGWPSLSCRPRRAGV